MKTMRKSIAVAVLCVVALPAAADDLAPTTIGMLKLGVPTAWRKTVSDATTRFSSPAGEAYFDVDVGSVQTGGLTPEACVKKITTSIGGEWSRLSIGSNPAAKKASASGNSRTSSETYVGCNGKTTWSVTFHAMGTTPLAGQITKSIRYAK